MKRAASWVATRRQADRNRAGDLRPPVKRGCLIDDLIKGHDRKVGKLHLDNRPQSLNGGPDRASDHRVLADWSVQDSPWKFFSQVLRRFEGATERPDILAVNVHTMIVSESLFLPLPNRFEVGNSHRTREVL